MSSNGFHDRLKAAAGNRTYRKLGELTGTHPETVRRYVQGQSPSVEFVSALCTALGISGEWLLTGNGPMRVSETRTEALKGADPGELLGAIAGTIDGMGDRLERLEVFVQVLESRVRGEEATVDGSGAVGTSERARRIGRAVTIGQRSALG